ncbi:MAG TPA: Abi-alpha family protein [Solirubrobacteraceae bacterium]|nr:Abi-alpha family protein [Solirubrobacteraceae bacterium]
MSQELVRRGDGWGTGDDAGARDWLTEALRVAAGAWLRGAAWGLGVSVRLLRSTGDPAAARELARDVVEDLQNLFRDLLGVSDLSLEARIKRLLPPAAAPVEERDRNGALHPAALRAEGAALLRRSADVSSDGDVHPAYAQILLALAPDEARILRLLGTEGPQPAVDVRSTQLVRGGDVVAEGLNMIGAEAGVHHLERVEVYLANLTRLGLIRFSSEPHGDAIAYQVLEAQPHVLAAVRDASRARTIQRSIRLSSFGEGFCQICLPPDDEFELSAPDSVP